MHNTQKGCSGYVTSEATNTPALEVNDEGIAKTLTHESDSLIVRGNISALAKVRDNFHLFRKTIQRIALLPLAKNKPRREHNQRQQCKLEEGFHRRKVTPKDHWLFCLCRRHRCSSPLIGRINGRWEECPDGEPLPQSCAGSAKRRPMKWLGSQAFQIRNRAFDIAERVG